MEQDVSTLVRQWIVVHLLAARPQGLTVRELAGEMSVCEKTVRRDLRTFQQAGFPLCETLGPYGRKSWRLEAIADAPPLRFTFEEAAALHLGRRLMQPLLGTMLWDAAQRAFSKVRAMLTPGALAYLEKFAPLFHQTECGAGDYTKKAELLDRLVLALEERRITHITYQSLAATEPVTYDVYPLGLVQHRHSLYLVGWAPRRNRKQHWKIDRIEAVEVDRLQFQQPEQFNLREHLSKSFGIYQGDGEVHVKIRFAPTVARYVQESRWHESQKLTPQKDGSVLAEFDLSTTEEIKRWLLGFGRHAEALAPQRLREEIAEEAALLLRQYLKSAGNDENPAKGAHKAGESE